MGKSTKLYETAVNLESILGTNQTIKNISEVTELAAPCFKESPAPKRLVQVTFEDNTSIVVGVF